MKKYGVGELKALSDFFNMIAVAWFTGGIVAPFFSRVSSFEKTIFFIVGSFLSYFFLKIALIFMRGVER